MPSILTFFQLLPIKCENFAGLCIIIRVIPVKSRYKSVETTRNVKQKYILFRSRQFLTCCSFVSFNSNILWQLSFHCMALVFSPAFGDWKRHSRNIFIKAVKNPWSTQSFKNVLSVLDDVCRIPLYLAGTTIK